MPSPKSFIFLLGAHTSSLDAFCEHTKARRRANMASAYPRSAEEAKEHIRQIRRDKGLGDDPGQLGNNAADLESALKV